MIQPASTTTTPTFPVVDLLSLRLHALTEKECVLHIATQLSSGTGGWVVTANLDFLRQCEADEDLQRLFKTADLVVADGQPLIWAGRLKGTPFPERVAGSDLISSLSAEAAARKQSVFLVGGAPGTAEASARLLASRYPGLRIAGALCPEMGFEKSQSREAEVIDQIVSTKPEIVYVAFGCPKAERFIGRNRHRLPGAWWMGVGISFSFLTGEVQRAPDWMRKGGLEWLHRLIQEPRRLAKRYLIYGIPFGIKLLAWSVVGRLRGAPAQTGAPRP